MHKQKQNKANKKTWLFNGHQARVNMDPATNGCLRFIWDLFGKSHSEEQ